jgi:hypothetical protein
MAASISEKPIEQRKTHRDTCHHHRKEHGAFECAEVVLVLEQYLEVLQPDELGAETEGVLDQKGLV